MTLAEAAPKILVHGHRGECAARLVREAGPVLDRVNHPRMTSTYPPVALAASRLLYTR